MTATTLNYRVRLLYATAAALAADNRVLLEGERGLESDTGLEKVGDGTQAWVDLPYRPGQIYSGATPPADTSLLWLDTSQ